MMEDEAVGRVSAVPSFGNSRRGEDRSDAGSVAGTAVTEDAYEEGEEEYDVSAKAAPTPPAKSRKLNDNSGRGGKKGATAAAKSAGGAKGGAKGGAAAKKSSKSKSKGRYAEDSEEEDDDEGEDDEEGGDGDFIEFDDEEQAAMQQLGLGDD
jgi:hypothetical protein